MAATVGIIDPSLRRDGHHAYFVSYIYRLLRRAGLNVVVADFGNVIRDNTDIDRGDLLNLDDRLPTELFDKNQPGIVGRILQHLDMYRFYKGLEDKIDAAAGSWIIATYDPYSLPVLYYSGLRKHDVVPVVHFGKFFRKKAWKIYGIKSYWTPHLLLRNLASCRGVLHLLDEHREQLAGRCRGEFVYLPYNSIAESAIERDNRDKLGASFRICTLGIIRDDKDIKFVMDVVKDRPDIEYFVGGKVAAYWDDTPYMDETRELVAACGNISAKFGFLSRQEYDSQIERSHFSVIPINTKYASGVQLTGLLFDSLINKRPFIGPDIFPLNQFADRHGVGVLYEPGNPESLRHALDLSMDRGLDHYYSRVCAFLREYSFDRTSERLRGLLTGNL